MVMHNAMKEHFKNHPISLHVPGHHYQTIGHLKHIDLKYDVTEITGMDDYHHAEGIIAKSQLKINKPGYESRYLVNGTTIGLLSVILAYIKASHEPSIAIMRNAHKSIYNAITLGKGSAYILPTVVSEKTQEYSGIDIEEIDVARLKHIKLAVLTYPNYFGETYDIKAVIDFFHNHHIPVLIDEAHGAHFDITNNFPVSTLNYGADYVVQSFHKTLPAFTMSSVIHMNSHVSDKMERSVNQNLMYLQSSSPSYLLMLGLEHANDFYKNFDDALFFERRLKLINQLKSIFDVIEVADPLKIMLSRPGYKGSEIAEILEQCGVYTELSNEKFALCVLPLWHVDDTYPFDELLNRMKNIVLEERLKLDVDRSDLLYNQRAGIYISRENIATELIDLEKGTGRQSAEHIIPYPPGIPFILAGETITERHIAQLTSHIAAGGKVHGIRNNKIQVIE